LAKANASLAHAYRNILHCSNYADSSSDGRLLGLDTGGFHKSRRYYTLALHEAHELGVRHVHWLAPVISDPLAQIRPGEHAPDVIRKLVNYAGRSVSRRPYSIPDREVESGDARLRHCGYLREQD
jgi:hypothetical protein